MCDNVFLESDGFCVKCGEVHPSFRKPNRKSISKPSHQISPTPTQIEKTRRIQDTISYTPQYRVPKELILKVASDFGVNVKVIFRNRSVSCASVMRDTIILSYQDCDRRFAEGHVEYATCRWILTKYFGKLRVPGILGTKLIALHEMSHVLEFRLNEGFARRGGRNVYHGEGFQGIFCQLIEMYLADEIRK